MFVSSKKQTKRKDGREEERKMCCVSAVRRLLQSVAATCGRCQMTFDWLRLVGNLCRPDSAGGGLKHSHGENQIHFSTVLVPMVTVEKDMMQSSVQVETQLGDFSF